MQIVLTAGRVVAFFKVADKDLQIQHLMREAGRHRIEMKRLKVRPHGSIACALDPRRGSPPKPPPPSPPALPQPLIAVVPCRTSQKSYEHKVRRLESTLRSKDERERPAAGVVRRDGNSCRGSDNKGAAEGPAMKDVKVSWVDVKVAARAWPGPNPPPLPPPPPHHYHHHI